MPLLGQSRENALPGGPPPWAGQLGALAAKIEAIQAAARPAREGVVPTGIAPLDRLLPQAGLARGTLTEWLASESASGAATLALAATAAAARSGGMVVVVDRPGTFYPPAAVALGVDLERLIVVRPRAAVEEAWAVDQALRSRGVAAVWCPLEKIAERTLRRWQLAAAGSGVLALLVRPAAARAAPSWAELRLGVRPVVGGGDGQRRLRVELLRPQTARAGTEVEFTFNVSASSIHETHPLHLAAPLEKPVARRRRA